MALRPFSWLSRRILAARRRAHSLALIGDVLRWRGQALVLAEASAVMVCEANVYAGDVLTLVLVFPGDCVVAVPQDDAIWPALVAALGRLWPSEPTIHEAITRLLADPTQATITLRRAHPT